MPPSSADNERTDSSDTPDDGRQWSMPVVGELDYIGGAVKRALLLALAILVLSFLAPQIFDKVLDVLSQAERLREIRLVWFLLMLGAEILSFLCLWWLIRILLPKVSWFVAATSQLTANSVSRVVPGGGGAAAGGATLYRMLAVSGTKPTEAGGALAAMSVLSTAALAAIPVIGVAIALFGAPIPEGLSPIAIASAVLCVLLLSVGAISLRTTAPLLVAGRTLDRILRSAGKLFRKTWSVNNETLVRERDRLAELLGKRWPQAMAASALNWTFDYLVLVFALYAVDANPRLSLVMVAYASGAVLSMISITPGGFGFVEVGLVGVLTLSGIPSDTAAVAVLAYRGVSLWLPIASGLFAWFAFRMKHPRGA
ncbi:MAG: hypothetical protein ACI81L_001734 [Verrucomicrobiales bacterium]|jgi:uncharacterized protein (TIRG00374 family)